MGSEATVGREPACKKKMEARGPNAGGRLGPKNGSTGRPKCSAFGGGVCQRLWAPMWLPLSPGSGRPGDTPHILSADFGDEISRSGDTPQKTHYKISFSAKISKIPQPISLVTPENEISHSGGGWPDAVYCQRGRDRGHLWRDDVFPKPPLQA